MPKRRSVRPCGTSRPAPGGNLPRTRPAAMSSAKPRRVAAESLVSRAIARASGTLPTGRRRCIRSAPPGPSISSQRAGCPPQQECAASSLACVPSWVGETCCRQVVSTHDNAYGQSGFRGRITLYRMARHTGLHLTTPICGIFRPADEQILVQCNDRRCSLIRVGHALRNCWRRLFGEQPHAADVKVTHRDNAGLSPRVAKNGPASPAKNFRLCEKRPLCQFPPFCLRDFDLRWTIRL